MKIIRTERGWAGHHTEAERCLFRRNTLLEAGKTRLIISTVGRERQEMGDSFKRVGDHRYYETLAFHADPSSQYHDIVWARPIAFDVPWCIDWLDADEEANAMHERVVEEVTSRLKKGGYHE